jgi:hypothetical protein
MLMFLLVFSLRTCVCILHYPDILPALQAFCDAMVDKFSSIDMKSTSTKTVLELKGELRLICSTADTWELWTQFFDVHTSGDLIDPNTEEKYNEVEGFEMPKILREFFRPLQGLTESELKRCAWHLLYRTEDPKLKYPKIFLQRPKHKPGTYSIKEWCTHRKLKTAAIIMRELHALQPQYQIFDVDGEVNWDHWRVFKQAYNIRGSSMRWLVREHTASLKLKGNKRAKKSETDAQEVNLYRTFLERKKKASFAGSAKFCAVTSIDGKTLFSKWDGVLTRADIREDRLGSPFALIDFRSIPGAKVRGTKDMPFYNPFMGKFMEYKSPAMREPHVWLWIVEQERLSDILELYEKTIKFEYSIYHSTYVPAKTEGIVVINEDRGHRQVGAVSLVFLTYNQLREGRAHIKASTIFKKIYSIPQPSPKELFEETIFTMDPAVELRMEFYVSILQSLAVHGDTVYSVFGGSKFMYAAMVSSLIKLRTLVRKFFCSIVSVIFAFSKNPHIYERTFVNVNAFIFLFFSDNRTLKVLTFTNARSYLLTYDVM